MKKERMERLPVNENDLVGVEAWLVEMAGKGLFLTETASTWWYFRQAEPQRLSYRLELMEKTDGKLKDETKAAYEGSGWTYVTTHETLYHIFSSAAGEGREPYGDSEVRGAQIRMYERRMRDSVWSIATLLLLIFVSHRAFWIELKAQPALALVSSTFPLLIIEVVLLAALTVKNLNNLRIVRELRRQTTGQDGRFIPPAVMMSDAMIPGKRRTPYGSIGLGLLVVLFCVFVFRSCGRGGPIEQQLEAGDVFPALQHIENGIVESLEVNEERGSGDIIYYSSPFVKEHYEVSQLGRVKSDAEDRGYLASLNAEYYETYSEKMAQAILEEWLEEATANDNAVRDEDKKEDTQIAAAEFKEQNAEGFDVYLLAAEAGSRMGLQEQRLFARCGSKVLSLTYVGREALAEKSGVLRELLE